MIFSDRPADINALLAQATKVIAGAASPLQVVAPTEICAPLLVKREESDADKPPVPSATLASYEDLLGDKYKASKDSFQ